jgi:hypothetical protein
MNAPRKILSFVILSAVLCSLSCGSGPSKQPFDTAKWNAGRNKNPGRNECPSMLDDLMTKHLSRGMVLEDVTNLLGQAEVKTSLGAVTRIRGEFITQIAYVYQPGMHKGWMVQGTNSLILWFGQRDEYLREWSPDFPVVQPVSAAESEAVRDARKDGHLHVGNLRFAGTPSQFDTLLGRPDETRIEHQLDYFLGKRSRFAWDEVFLDLHFDKSNRLSRMTCSEH